MPPRTVLAGFERVNGGGDRRGGENGEDASKDGCQLHGEDDVLGWVQGG